MNNIKLVLADLDGTVVLPEAMDASEEVINSVRQAESSGVKFAAVTGRPFWMAKELLQKIGLVNPCIFEGGAVIINPVTEVELWSKKVPKETTKKAVEILAPHCSIIEYGVGIIKMVDIKSEEVENDAYSIWASIPIEKADILVDKLRLLPHVAVHSNDGPAGDFTRSGIQVTHFEADKEHAVKVLLEIDGTDPEHTLAIGDGNNDIPLFKNAKIKVAMGNGSDKLKAEADYIVDDVNGDGFAEAIYKYVLD